MKSRLLFAGCVCWLIASRSIFASDDPRLSITNAQGEFVVSWPGSATNWVLESSAVLLPWAPWACVMPESYEMSGASRLVRIAPGAASRFYRLRTLTPAVPGLTGSWQLDEGAGQVAGEGSGSGLPMFLSSVGWAGGRFGPGSLQFNGGAPGAGGSRAWVSNENYRVLPAAGQPFSVSLWFNPDSLSAGVRGLMGNNANGTNGWQVVLRTPTPGANDLMFSGAGAGASLSVTGRTLLLPGQWHQLTVTHNGVEGSLYLDGELLARGSGGIIAHPGPIYFGGGVGGYDSFLGRIDDVRAYTNCLTPEQIALTGHWRFDEGCGGFIADSSVQGHHGSVTDPTAWALGHEGTGVELSRGQVVIGNEDHAVLPRTGGPFSISLWLRPDSLPGGRSGLMNCGMGTIDGWQLVVEKEPGGGTRLTFNSTNSGGTLDLWAPLALTAGVWSKLDLTYNGAIATVYADGRKVQVSHGAIRASKAGLVIGAAPGTTDFNGVIDDLRIYCRERGEAEVGPVAPAIWETVLANTATNLVLPGSGPAGKPLTYSIVPILAPTNGMIAHTAGSPVVTYTAGGRRGPDAFTYTVSDGEFTSVPALAMVSVVQPHWLSPGGGSVGPADGSSPAQSWPAGAAGALDAIWKTNNFYDCFFYAPGEYETRGWKFLERSTANPGCKHIGAGYAGSDSTTLRLVDIWSAFGEETIFNQLNGGPTDGFEVQHMILDCNAANVPKYAQGEPVWIRIPLVTTGLVNAVTLRWADKVVPGSSPPLPLGRATEFSVCAIKSAANVFVTNCTPVVGTGQSSIVNLGVEADELFIQLSRRATGVEFYGLSEIELSGAATGVPLATIPGAGESRLDAAHSIVQAVDQSMATSWASGPESQVQIELPMPPGTSVSQVNLYWNCKTLSGLGRLGPAAGYLIRAWDGNDGQYHDVPLVRHGRTASGSESATFGTTESTNPVVTSRLLILLTNREPGVDYYSLREVTLQNGSGPVKVPQPTSFNSLGLGDYSILRAFDRDTSTEWASGFQGGVGAIAVSGNNLKFSHLKIVGFGTKIGRENFPMSISPNPSAEPTRMGNILVEDCILSNPATHNSDGISALVMNGNHRVSLTNAVVRRCTVSDLKPYFRYSQALAAAVVENCLVTNCSTAIYYEPDTNPIAGDDNSGPILVRSNLFTDVDTGILIKPHPAARFDSITCLNNEIVLSGRFGWGFVICDTCYTGPTGTTTNVTVLNNIIRYADWASRPAYTDGGLYYSDIQHAVFGNNVVALGTPSSLRVRWCPSGLIPPPDPVEDCDHPLLLPLPPPSYPPCLDTLPPGYRRAWFGNRDLSGTLLPVRFSNNNVEGLSSQQQFPE